MCEKKGDLGFLGSNFGFFFMKLWVWGLKLRLFWGQNGGFGVKICWDLGGKLAKIWGLGVKISWDNSLGFGDNLGFWGRNSLGFGGIWGKWGFLGSKLDGIWGEIWKMDHNGDLGLKNWLKFGVKMGKIHRIWGILVYTN